MSAYEYHPEFPSVKDKVEYTLRVLGENHHVFGWRLVSEGNGDGTWGIKGWIVVTEHKETGVKGIIEFDRQGYGVRDSLLHGREEIGHSTLADQMEAHRLKYGSEAQ